MTDSNGGRRADAARIAANAASTQIELAATHRVEHAAALLSSATYRDLAARRPIEALNRLQRVVASYDHPPTATFADAFDEAYECLVREYRNEYVYKNAIVSKIVFGRHRPTTASAIIEMPLGGSFARRVRRPRAAHGVGVGGP